MSKLFDKKDLTSLIISMFVPKIRISSTYEHNIKDWPPPC
jgi:hypothetical protein